MTIPPDFFDLPPPRLLCGRPLPPWTDLLAAAGIPDAPGHHETAASLREHPGVHGCKSGTPVAE
jgi:hypothetical protein